MAKWETHPIHSRNTGAWLYLDEVMHRVINDYTVMLSTVRLASTRVSDAQSGQVLNELSTRLHAAATAFRALSPPLDPSPRRLDAELETLCGTLTSTLLAKSAIRLALIAKPVCVDARQCWKISLVVSELITNAARHAFHKSEGGSIVVELSVEAGFVRCAVIDNGSAPATIAPGRGSSILEAIAAEVGGTIVRNHTSRGSAVALLLPLGEAADLQDQCSLSMTGGFHDQHKIGE
jgi:two-component sensor histidine kinase